MKWLLINKPLNCFCEDYQFFCSCVSVINVIKDRYDPYNFAKTYSSKCIFRLMVCTQSPKVAFNHSTPHKIGQLYGLVKVLRPPIYIIPSKKDKIRALQCRKHII